MAIIAASTVTDIVFHHLITVKTVQGQIIQCIIEIDGIWSHVDTILLFVHHLAPFVLYVYSFLMIIRMTAQSKSSVRQQSFLSAFWLQIKQCKEQVICLSMMIISSLPQLIIVLAVQCEQWDNMLLRHVILSAYLISHLPETTSFFLFIFPSTLFRKAFFQTLIGKWFLNRRRWRWIDYEWLPDGGDHDIDGFSIDGEWTKKNKMRESNFYTCVQESSDYFRKDRVRATPTH